MVSLVAPQGWRVLMRGAKSSSRPAPRGNARNLDDLRSLFVQWFGGTLSEPLVGRRFDAASPVTRSLDVTVALKNSRAPGGTDTIWTREVDQATHAVASNQMIESRQRG
jgi:hypothetical protein